MPRKKTGHPRTGSSLPATVTRRAVLGAAAVIGGAGVADALHKPSHRGTPTSDARTGTTAAGQTTHLTQPGTTGSSSPAGQSSSSPPLTSHSATPPAPHHHGGGQHLTEHPGGHGRSHAEHRVNPVEHVDLPAAKVKVRTRPVYSISELTSDVPKHAIALTVDDGPDPEWTPKVLRLLDKYRMQASFCVIGMHADAYPGLVRDVARAGHVIVNHTYTHVMPFNHQTEKRIVAEITRAQRSIERAAKFSPQLFRAPGGAWSPFIFRAVAAYGLTPLDWDIDPMDWTLPGTRKIEHAMLRGHPGDIVLCHDGGGNRSETVRALRKVLPTWKHRGYTTIPLVVPDSVKLPKSPPSKPSGSPTPTVSATDSASISPTP